MGLDSIQVRLLPLFGSILLGFIQITQDHSIIFGSILLGFIQITQNHSIPLFGYILLGFIQITQFKFEWIWVIWMNMRSFSNTFKSYKNCSQTMKSNYSSSWAQFREQIFPADLKFFDSTDRRGWLGLIKSVQKFKLNAFQSIEHYSVCILHSDSNPLRYLGTGSEGSGDNTVTVRPQKVITVGLLIKPEIKHLENLGK